MLKTICRIERTYQTSPVKNPEELVRSCVRRVMTGEDRDRDVIGQIEAAVNSMIGPVSLTLTSREGEVVIQGGQLNGESRLSWEIHDSAGFLMMRHGRIMDGLTTRQMLRVVCRL